MAKKTKINYKIILESHDSSLYGFASKTLADISLEVRNPREGRKIELAIRRALASIGY
jgi:hypothetical protein